MWVLSSTTGQAAPSSSASAQRAAQTHHWSPGRSPGKPYSGIGVTRSLPRFDGELEELGGDLAAHDVHAGVVATVLTATRPVVARSAGRTNTGTNSPPSTLRCSSPPSQHTRRPRLAYVVAMLQPAIRDLATGKNFGVLSFQLPSGQLASHVMWVDANDEQLLINTEVHRAKYKAMQKNPDVTVTIWDLDNPYRYAEVRGRVIGEVRGDEARDHIDKLFAALSRP